ncbi:hypothetical protein AsFPU1_2570 [Aphanothece sacrum FPU1]|uniref:MotA/TolQ/ExbB proton channel domain-containing protein n=1 Tax=Aphanothece sacrum FPU1 TaxID=1920663 RepID=A0A401IIP4_APHSA|nr:hypothetical protein AsFPU1_2570 [Aphanothece sacrum FPU1]GBF83494.1 hypothetical protein AsFPU3_0536 [Aphanothece sacrum FPU3]
MISHSNEDAKPNIVKNLEKRFKGASLRVDKVNTEALIHGIYSQDKFKFLGYSLSCEQWDYCCRNLPNLLLAFGLLGTFLGITLNLSTLSQTISQVSGEANNFIEKFEQPLQSMGIAFITSLIALVCSSVLTVINLRYNTTLAKYFLMSSLEDYLDNILQPTIERETRFDKSINRMVNQQNLFLTKFHESVIQSVQSSLDGVAQQITKGNQETAKLAQQVYEQMTETAGTLDRGSITFYQSALLLEKQVKSLKRIVQHDNFVEYSKSLENTAIVFMEASEMIKNSALSEKLASVTDNLMGTQSKFSDTILTVNNLINTLQVSISNINQSVDSIVNLGDKIDNLNQKSTELIDLNKEQIKQESLSLQMLGDRLIKSLDTQTISQEDHQKLLGELTDKSTELIELNKERIKQESLGLQMLGDRLIKSLDTQTISQEDHQKLLGELTDKSTELIELNKERIKQESISLQMLGDRLEALKIRENEKQTVVIEIIREIKKNIDKIRTDIGSIIKSEKSQDKILSLEDIKDKLNNI